MAPRLAALPGARPSASDDATRIAPRLSVEARQIAPTVTLATGEHRLGHRLRPRTARRLARHQRIAARSANGRGSPATDHDLDFDLSGRCLDRRTTRWPTPTQIATAQIDASELGLHDLEPATLSEVGTKIDLARAYMDMGDPEGARILQEVLTEGSASQRQEAQRLMVGLPG